jgi:hypothetical protein
MIHFNGIDAESGTPTIPAMTPEQLRDRLYAAFDAGRLAPPSAGVHLGLGEGCDPERLCDAGWALVHHADDVAAADAVEELRQLRSADGVAARRLDYRTGEGVLSWLRRHGAQPGIVRAEGVPYYLLIVGVPEHVPFSFVQELACDRAVGSLGFATPDDYARYAAAVASCERSGPVATRRCVAFWAPSHDDVTKLSHLQLVQPLFKTACSSGYGTEGRLGYGATKAGLIELAARRPAVMFTASHGVNFPRGDARQLPSQGALLAADWRGGRVLAEHCVAATDVRDLELAGSIAFCFGCFTTGTPSHDRYGHALGAPHRLAHKPFASALSQALLARGALGFIGHVDRAFSFTFAYPGLPPDPFAFHQSLTAILAGSRIGHALRFFTQICTQLTRAVAPLCEALARGEHVDPVELAALWLQRNDAEGFGLVGDPAARLRVAELAR